MADKLHPLHCNDDGVSYRCQWMKAANSAEWNDYQHLELANIIDIPDFFVVSKDLIAGQVFSGKVAKKHKDALSAGQFEASLTADWYYMDGNGEAAECRKLEGTPKSFADAAAKRGASVETTGNDTSHADVVVWYEIQGKYYKVYFYKTLAGCSNPFNDPDRTKPDFSRINHAVNGQLDAREQALADEAVKSAGDRGPWWIFDGARLNPSCIRSKLTPLQDAQEAKARGARNVQIHGGLIAENLPRPRDIVVEYDLNGKGFYKDYFRHKDCDSARG